MENNQMPEWAATLIESNRTLSESLANQQKEIEKLREKAKDPGSEISPAMKDLIKDRKLRVQRLKSKE